MKTKKEPKAAILKKAWRLISDRRFLFNAAAKIGELGVVGESMIRLIVLLSCIGRSLNEPASVMVKGSPSSGKSTAVKRTLRIFPQHCIIERAGLSKQALAYGNGSLAGKILFISEFRSAKDAQLLLRLLQSEGQIARESTIVRGSRRRTTTARRTGTPTVLTTTTADKVFADDETRFLSVWVDESPEQTLAILKAKATALKVTDPPDLQVWRKAMSLLKTRKHDFEHPPAWLEYVAEQLPLAAVKTRREWERCLGFLKAVALCRRRPDADQVLDVTFPDYCVAYHILEPVLAATVSDLDQGRRAVTDAVAALNKRFKRSVRAREIAEELGWKESLVRKHLAAAIRRRLLDYEPGTREKNVKLVRINQVATDGFLPRPWMVFKNNPGIGSEARYVDPFTGKRKIMRRKQ